MHHPSPRLDEAFAALADSTRRAILARLVDGEATATELAEPFSISQPAISRHLKVLESAELIVRRTEGTKRYCRLAPAALDEVQSYLDMLRRAFEANYARLDTLLAKTSNSKGHKKK